MTVTLKTPRDIKVEWVPGYMPVATLLTGEMTLFSVKGKTAAVFHDGRPYMIARVALRPVKGE